jgi:hypothetical protein
MLAFKNMPYSPELMNDPFLRERRFADGLKLRILK